MKGIGAMAKRFSLVSASVLLVSVLAVEADAGEPESHYPVPAEAVAGAREYAISKVGEAFFDAYMTWNPALSCFRDLDPRRLGWANTPDWLKYPRYIIVYNFRIPEKPHVDEIVVVNIKEDGGWFQDAAHDEGLPDCVTHQGECEFLIDEEAAIEIAREAGLKEGNGPWRVDFRWFGRDYHTYAWEVQNELGERRGESVLIDANDGAVINMGEWSITVSGHGPSIAP